MSEADFLVSDTSRRTKVVIVETWVRECVLYCDSETAQEAVSKRYELRPPDSTDGMAFSGYEMRSCDDISAGVPAVLVQCDRCKGYGSDPTLFIDQVEMQCLSCKGVGVMAQVKDD